MLIKNGSVLIGPSFKKADLLVEQGVIKRIFAPHETERFGEFFDAEDFIVIPGLINCHMHSYTGLLKGTVDAVPLDIYMLYAMAGGSKRTPEEIYVSSAVEALQALKSGTTTIIDHFSRRPSQEVQGIEAAIKAYLDVGIRAVVAPMYADKAYHESVPWPRNDVPDVAQGKRPAQSAAQFLEVCREAIQKWHGVADNRIRIMLGTDGPQRCSQQLLEGTAALEQQFKVGWHSHILESKTQAVQSRAVFNKGLLDYVDDLGLLNERTSLVHFVWGTESEIELAARRGASVVHCPASNLHLGSGIAPINKMLGVGINVCLGSDGGNCGSLDMFEHARLAARLHRITITDHQEWINSANTVRLMTENGAKAALMDQEIGAISEGKRADLVFLKLNGAVRPWGQPDNRLMYYVSAGNVDSVMVNGEFVVKDGKCITVNEAEIICRAEEIVVQIQRNNSEAFKKAEKQVPCYTGMYKKALNTEVGFERLFRSDAGQRGGNQDD